MSSSQQRTLPTKLIFLLLNHLCIAESWLHSPQTLRNLFNCFCSEDGTHHHLLPHAHLLRLLRLLRRSSRPRTVHRSRSSSLPILFTGFHRQPPWISNPSLNHTSSLSSHFLLEVEMSVFVRSFYSTLLEFNQMLFISYFC